LHNLLGESVGRKRLKRQAASRKNARRRSLFESLEDRSLMAVLSPPLDSVIEAIDSDQNTFNNNGLPVEPPDNHGAVGPNHVLNVINQSIQWFTKTGEVQAHTSLTNFFSPLFPAPGTGPFDPKAMYDAESGRYIVIALELLDVGNGDAVNASRILVAVSDDSDPNGSWRYQSINAMLNISGASQWFDYPGLAIDSQAIYITGNMFPFSDAPATAAMGGSRLWIIDKGLGKGGLYDGGISAANVYNPAGTAAAGAGFTLQPAQMFGQGPTISNGVKTGTWLIAYNGTSSGGNESVLTVRVDNPLNNPTFFTQTVQVGNIDDTLNTVSPGLPTQFLPPVPQRGTTALLDFSDRRMLHAVWRNNSLYATAPVLPGSGPDTNQVTLHWFRIDTSNPSQLTLADQGNIGGEDVGSNVHTSYGSIAVDPAGNMAIGFSASGPGMFAGSYYAVRAATDPAGTMRGARAVATGVGAYGATGSTSRWGDYAATVLDPVDQATFWTYNMYGLGETRYGTRWGSFHLLPTNGNIGGGGGGGGGGATGDAFVAGTKWNDANKNGIKDPTETAVAGFTMYVDVNGNDKIDIGEPAATTGSDGQYLIRSNKLGTYAVREVPLPGWTQIFPGQAQSFEHVVTLVAGQTVSGINFGNNGVVFDFGDAPAPYPTLLKDNGGRSAVLANFHLGPPSVSATGVALGVEPDAEADGLPEANAQGDDTTGVDDEDGIIFNSNLIAGANASITVTVTTGSSPEGALQGWVDFNGDGDWLDAGEQIFKNRLLSEGTYTLTFPVPIGAKTGTTYARFRYGYESNIGPTGMAQAGEIEDYQVQVISDQPIANADSVNVNQASNNNQIDVLANDFASSQGGLRIQSVSNPTQQSGTAVIFDKGTVNPSDDVILYTPPSSSFIGNDSFTYTITDNSGKTSTATVTVAVESLTNDPIAVDDSFTRTTAQIQTLDVRSNDIVGKNGPILITSVTQPDPGKGTITITSGGQLLQYTPPSTSFSGNLQFTYTISDASSPLPKTSTAKVTMHIGSTTADDVMSISLRPFDLNGNPITVIAPGQDFELRAFVQDLRTDDTVGAPTDRLGVYAAYFDTLYSNNLVSIVGPVTFNADPAFPGGPFVSGQSGVTSTPGLIDEVGAFEGTNPKFTQNALLLYTVRMRANAEGQATFTADPADNLPLHDCLLFEPPTPPVGYEQITYGSTSLFIGNPASVLFKAVDDSLTATATGPTTLQVLNNDLAGINAPIIISSVTPVGTFQGALTRSADNKTVIYSAPGTGFTGVQQFDYTIRDTAGNTSTARATIFAGTAANLASNDKVSIRLAAWDPVASREISTVEEGSTFQIRAYVKDLRTDDGDGDPNTNRLGVFAAYTDVIYNFNVASFVANSADSTGFFFDPNYRNGKSGNSDIPGLLDEVGAFQTGTTPLRGNEVLLFAANFKADKPGTFTYSANPADASPLHDVLLFNPPAPPVTIDQINYFVTPSSLSGTLTITAAGGGEAEYTNTANPLDVNNDGFVTPIDALLIINNMNSFGSRALVSGGGGETGTGGAARVYLDVNADKFLSAIDALLVCNFLNKPANGEGEGEGAAEWSDATLSSVTATADLGGVILVGMDTLPGSSSIAPAAGSSSTGTVTSVVESKSLVTASVLPETTAPQPFVFKSAADTVLQDVLDDLAADLAQMWG
jgi:hypothetical protein